MSDFSAEVALSSTKTSLLEPLKVELTLTYPKEYHPDLDALRSHLAKHFILLTEKISEPIPKNNALSQTLAWTLASETPGPKMVTFYNIPFLAEGKKPVELISDLYPVEIFLPKVDLDYTGELAPLSTFSKTPKIAISEKNIQLESPDYHTQKIAAKTLPLTPLAALFGLLIFTFLIYRFRHKVRPIPKKEAQETALETLEKIETLQEEEYFAKITAVVRGYIQERYHFKAPSNTSQECLQKINKQINPGQQELLKIFFKATDEVNYAHHKPTSEERKSAEAFAKRFIKGS